MAEQQEDTLIQDVEQFQEEEEKIKNLLGQIGGKRGSKSEKVLHIILVAMLVGLFSLTILKHTVDWGMDPVFYLELGVFLVSLKIIWMIHKQTRVAHFQFWILNTIEFRITDSSKRLQRLEKQLANQNQKGKE